MSFEVSFLPNGIPVVTYAMSHVQSVAINVTVCAGSRCESSDTHGIAHFAEHMAFKDTYKRTAK